MIEKYKLEIGNSKELLKNLPDNSIDAIVTDPPYELGFMGKKWDASGIAYDVELWAECLRVLKPGGHLLAFSGSRTYHRMTVAIEDAGFDIRDQIMWIYGSGFPKSHDVSKAIDKMAGAERDVVGFRNLGAGITSMEMGGVNTGKTLNGRCPIKAQIRAEKARNTPITAPATDAAKEWNGWGTALKPAHEPICVARKPLIGTVAENVLQYGTGAFNIDGCRVGSEQLSCISTFKRINDNNIEQGYRPETMRGSGGEVSKTVHGRFPANLIHDGSAEVLAGFPESVRGAVLGSQKVGEKTGKTNNIYGVGLGNNKISGYKEEVGSAARFFYCAKASKKDRNEGHQINNHPTVKPTDLMQYLCRLVTPQNGIILDPFTGSGSTGKAAILEGFRFIGFDMQHEYIEIAKARIEFAIQKKNEIEIKKENTLFDE